jgi:3-methylcrotonyl-CoA carboxylase alpha subunit
MITGFRANAEPDLHAEVRVGGHSHLVAIEAPLPTSVAVLDGGSVLFLDGEAWPFARPRAADIRGGGAVSDGTIVAPMPGRIASLAVSAGDTVAKGQRLLVLEAMKMEQGLVAPFDGVVAEIMAVCGAQVSEGALLVFIEKDA